MPDMRCSRTACASHVSLASPHAAAADSVQGTCIRQAACQPAAGGSSLSTAPFLPCAIILQASTWSASCVSACMAPLIAVQLLTLHFPARSTYELRYFNIADNEGEEEE